MSDEELRSAEVPEVPEAPREENPDPAELADDGSPLGTLKVGGHIYAKDTMGNLARVATKELARSKSIDVTGDDDADAELLDAYEEYDNNEKRRRALVRYVKDGLTAAEVAKEVQVPERTVLMWAYHGKWNKAATRELAVRMEEESRALVNLRLRHRETLLARQVEDSSRIQRKLMEKVEGDEVSMKTAAESLAALAKVQNSAMGVADSGSVVTGVGESQEKKEASGAKQVLVAVFPGTSGIPVLGRKGDVIDVQ